MRIAVFSDIHGNLPALQAIITDARAQGADAFIAAGDLLARAPYPLEVMALLQETGALMIRGNADQYQIDYARLPNSGLSGPAFDVIHWTDGVIGESGLCWLESLPKEMVVTLPGLPPVRVVHGKPGDLNRMLVPNDAPVVQVFSDSGLWRAPEPPPPLEEQLAGLEETLLICGHSHIPWAARLDGRLAINPGGGGIPVNGDPRAQYALVLWDGQGWQVEHRAMTYDTTQLKAEYHASGLLEQGGAFARACMLNTQTGRNAARFIILLWRKYEQQTGDPETAWELAVKNFPWEEYGE